MLPKIASRDSKVARFGVSAVAFHVSNLSRHFSTVSTRTATAPTTSLPKMRPPRLIAHRLNPGAPRVPVPETRPSARPRSKFENKKAARHQRLHTVNDKPPSSSLTSRTQDRFDEESLKLYFEQKQEKLRQDLETLTRNSPYSRLAIFFHRRNYSCCYS